MPSWARSVASVSGSPRAGDQPAGAPSSGTTRPRAARSAIDAGDVAASLAPVAPSASDARSASRGVSRACSASVSERDVLARSASVASEPGRGAARSGRRRRRSASWASDQVASCGTR
ncbi:MAG: hypothetical protein BGO96_00070 [Micrococcales bacterium 73-15]|nr:MAG: hypothetical protein BGO96_00070 [Micrococcales bacterium 73-15]